MSNDGAGLHKELGFLLALLLIAGCMCPPCVPETSPKRYNCTTIEQGVSWECSKDGVEFQCQYKHLRGNDGQ